MFTDSKEMKWFNEKKQSKSTHLTSFSHEKTHKNHLSNNLHDLIIYTEQSDPSEYTKRTKLSEELSKLVKDYQQYKQKEMEDEASEESKEINNLDAQLFEIKIKRKLTFEEYSKFTYEDLVNLLIAKIEYIESPSCSNYTERNIISDSIKDIDRFIKSVEDPSGFIEAFSNFKDSKPKSIDTLNKYLIDKQFSKILVKIQCQMPGLKYTEKTLNLMGFLLGLMSFIIAIFSLIQGDWFYFVGSLVIFLLWLILCVPLAYDCKKNMKIANTKSFELFTNGVSKSIIGVKES